MDRGRALRVAGNSTPIVGAVVAGASLETVARVVDSSGCVGNEFDCLGITINAVVVTLIVCLVVAVALQWVVALSAVDGDGPRLGDSLALAVGGGVTRPLSRCPAVMRRVDLQDEQSDGDGDDRVAEPNDPRRIALRTERR